MHLHHPARPLGVMLALLSMVGTSLALAQEVPLQQYEVELLIFKPTNPTHTPEDWSIEAARAKAALPTVAETEDSPTPDGTAPPPAPATPVAPAAPAPAAPVAPATGDGAETSFVPIDAAQFRMVAQATALRRNRNYQVLAHVAWTQPGFAMNSARPFALDGIVSRDTGVTGTVSLVRGRYLHVTFDLAMLASDGKSYILREQRRMRRSGEKHYFDHPYFGVIVLVTPKDSR